MRWYVTTNYYDVRCNCGPFISGRGGVKGNLHFGLPLSIGDFKGGTRILRGFASRYEGIRCAALFRFALLVTPFRYALRGGGGGQLLNCRSISVRAVRSDVTARSRRCIYCVVKG